MRWNHDGERDVPKPTKDLRRDASGLAEQGRVAASRKAAQTVAKIERAKKVISAEIEKHGGVYPYQGGRLTAAEVLRRAGLDGKLLGKSRHKSLRDNVNRWVENAKKTLAQGKRTVRRAVTERATRAERELELTRQRFAEAELEYVEQANELTRLRARCAELEETVHQLQAKLQVAP